MCDRFYHCDKKYHATNKLFDEKSRNFIHLKHIAMDIGRKVKDVLLAKGITVKEFAERISCSRENAHRILARSHMDTDLIEKISRELNYDFFKYMSSCIFNHSDDNCNTNK